MILEQTMEQILDPTMTNPIFENDCGSVTIIGGELNVVSDGVY